MEEVSNTIFYAPSQVCQQEGEWSSSAVNGTQFMQRRSCFDWVFSDIEIY